MLKPSPDTRPVHFARHAWIDNLNHRSYLKFDSIWRWCEGIWLLLRSFLDTPPVSSSWRASTDHLQPTIIQRILVITTQVCSCSDVETFAGYASTHFDATRINGSSWTTDRTSNTTHFDTALQVFGCCCLRQIPVRSFSLDPMDDISYTNIRRLNTTHVDASVQLIGFCGLCRKEVESFSGHAHQGISLNQLFYSGY